MMLAGLPVPNDAVLELAYLVRVAGADELADRLEYGSPVGVRKHGGLEPFDREHVEDEQGQREPAPAMKHPRAEQVKVGAPVLGERDQLAIELQAGGNARAEFGQQVGHVPAAPAAGSEPCVRTEEAAKPVQLRLERPAAPVGDRAGSGEHGLGQPQQHERAYRVDLKRAQSP